MDFCFGCMSRGFFNVLSVWESNKSNDCQTIGYRETIPPATKIILNWWLRALHLLLAGESIYCSKSNMHAHDLVFGICLLKCILIGKKILLISICSISLKELYWFRSQRSWIWTMLNCYLGKKFSFCATIFRFVCIFQGLKKKTPNFAI